MVRVTAPFRLRPTGYGRTAFEGSPSAATRDDHGGQSFADVLDRQPAAATVARDVSLAREAGVRQLVLFHALAGRTDVELDRILSGIDPGRLSRQTRHRRLNNRWWLRSPARSTNISRVSKHHEPSTR